MMEAARFGMQWCGWCTARWKRRTILNNDNLRVRFFFMRLTKAPTRMQPNNLFPFLLSADHLPWNAPQLAGELIVVVDHVHVREFYLEPNIQWQYP